MEMAVPGTPIFLFIPGGWHSPEYFSPLVQALADSGYDSETVTLNINASPPLKDLEPEVEVILSKLNPLLEAGKNIIVVSHSYGGIPATEAIGRAFAAAGQGPSHAGRVLRMVYMTAFVPCRGDSMASMLGEFTEALDPALIDFDPPYTTVSETGYEILYHDVEQPYRSQIEKILGKHSIAVGVCPVRNVGWRFVPSTFIHAARDRCLLPSMQREMVEKARDVVGKERDGREAESGGDEKSFPVMPFSGNLGEFVIDAGHTAHVSRMEDVREVLVTLAKHHLSDS